MIEVFASRRHHRRHLNPLLIMARVANRSFGSRRHRSRVAYRPDTAVACAIKANAMKANDRLSRVVNPSRSVADRGMAALASRFPEGSRLS